MNSYTTGWVSAACQTHPLPELPHGLRKWIFLIHQEGLEPQRNCFGRPSTPAGKWRSEGGTHTVYPEPLAGGGGGDGSQVCPPHSPMALHRSRILRAGSCPPWPAPRGSTGEGKAGGQCMGRETQNPASLRAVKGWGPSPTVRGAARSRPHPLLASQGVAALRSQLAPGHLAAGGQNWGLNPPFWIQISCLFCSASVSWEPGFLGPRGSPGRTCRGVPGVSEYSRFNSHLAARCMYTSAQ